jgi:hypothetical protein
VCAGDYADLAGVQVVVMTAGTSLKPGETRLDLLAANVDTASSVLERVLAEPCCGTCGGARTGRACCCITMPVGATAAA